MNEKWSQFWGAVILIIILTLATLNLRSCNKVKNARTDLEKTKVKLEETKVNLEKAKVENTTLQEALKHPKVIEKPVEIIRWKEKVIEGANLGDAEVIEKIVEVERRGERISEPYLPPLFPVPEVGKKDWTFIGGRNITNGFWTLGFGRRIYKTMKVYGEYNFDSSIEAKISVDF